MSSVYINSIKVAFHLQKIFSYRDLLVLFLIVLTVSILVILLMIVRKIYEYYNISGRIPDRNWDTSPYSTRMGQDYLHEDVNNLQYDKQYELNFENLKINRPDSLGSGNYGVVGDGILDVTKQWKKSGMLPKFARNDRIIPVAIKAPKVADEEIKQVAIKMLYDELKILCAVGQHPNVLTLIGAVTSRLNSHGELYVIVEKCENNSLLKYLKNNTFKFHSQIEEAAADISHVEVNGYLYPDGAVANTDKPIAYKQPEMKVFNTKLTTSHLISFAWQTAIGMKHLSAIKCVHRDLAARNVLITSNGVCKVSDFGMARNIAEKEYYRLRSRYPLPTRWMAPEALEKATVQSDMWSFGILLYEIFSLGGLPYPTISSDKVIDAVLLGIRNEKPSHAHPNIYKFMRNCWELESSNRPNFKEAARLLEDHLNRSSKQFYINVCHQINKEWKKQEYLKELRTSSKAKEFTSNAQDYFYNHAEYLMTAGPVRQTISDGSCDQTISDSSHEGSFTC